MSFRRTRRTSRLLAFGAVVGAALFIALAASLNPEFPSPSLGLPTLPIGLLPSGSGGVSPSGPEPSASEAIDSRLAFVPVVGFRAVGSGTTGAEVDAIATGSSPRYTAVEILRDGADATLLAIGISTLQTGRNVLLAADAASLKADLRAHPDRLGFLPLADVDPSVRALDWNGLSLFGVHRLATLDGWPLKVDAAPGSVPATADAYDPATAWTLVAGGDITLDGQVSFHVKQLGFGVDWPFNGWTATITGHTCCSSAGLPLPIAKRVGVAGTMQALLSTADLSIADFENPAPNNFAYHASGTRYSADPDLIAGLANAGIDWVSLANDHIGDYGEQGILDTLQNLDTWGIAHGGAEASLDAAREPTLLDVAGITVGILAYDTIKPAYGATATRAGSVQMTEAGVATDVQFARAAGAGLVIVVPHWGTDYSAATTALQRRLAHAAIDAGADIVIGSHTQVAGGLEVYKGRPIAYSLGDFVVNVARSEATEEGILLELTYAGSRLVQVRLLPFLILDGSQPNLLDPAGSGSVVLKQVFGASPGLPW